MVVENFNIVDNLSRDKIPTFLDEIDRVSKEHFMNALRTEDMNEVDDIAQKLKNLDKMKTEAMNKLTHV